LKFRVDAFNPEKKSLQNWSAEHRLGTKRGTFHGAEAVLGAPKAGG